MTFRLKLFAAIAGTLLVTLGVAFSLVLFIVARSELRDLDDALLAEAREEVLEISVAGDEARVSTEPLETGVDSHLLRYATVYRHDGTVLFSTPSFVCGVPKLEAVRRSVDQPFDLSCGKTNLRGVFKNLQNHPDHLLLLAVSRTQLDDDVRSLVKVMFGALVVSLILAGLTAGAVAKGLARGQEEMARTVRRVSEGDLKARIESSTSDPNMRQLALDINAMVERLAALLGTQERFVANAAHELRSPVTALYGELSLALRKERSSAEYLETIVHARESTQQLRDLMEDLLALASARHETAREKLSLQTLLRNVVDQVQNTGPAKDIAFTITPEDATVVGHQRDIERLLRNVLENGARHAVSAVRVTLAHDAKSVVLRIADDGAGVTAEDCEQLFEPFYRGRRERALGSGTGLGLPIARAVARAHGGDVVLEQAQPQATFAISLPKDLHS